MQQQTQNSVESISITAVLLSRFSHYYGITVTFVPVTVTTVAKYIAMSPLPRYYHYITVQRRTYCWGNRGGRLD